MQPDRYFFVSTAKGIGVANLLKIYPVHPEVNGDQLIETGTSDDLRKYNMIN